MRIGVFEVAAVVAAIAAGAWGVAVLAAEGDRIRLGSAELAEIGDVRGFDLRAAQTIDAHAQSCRRDFRRAEVAVRAGLVQQVSVTVDPDGHDAAARDYTRALDALLACSPSDGNAWLLAALDARTRGRSAEAIGRLLTASLDTGPREGWTTVRLLAFAVPRLQAFDPATRGRVADTFANEVRHGDLTATARIGCTANDAAKAELVAPLDEAQAAAVAAAQRAVCP